MPGTKAVRDQRLNRHYRLMTRTGPIRVLVADDHLVVRRGIGALLASLDGVEVVSEASTGAEAIREAQLTHPDVIIMDLQMPGMDGIDATRRLTALLPEVAVLVLTMFEDDDSVLSAMRAGARGYLLKDQPMSDCLEAIAEIRRGGSPINPLIARQLLSQLTGERPAPAPPPVSPLSEREMEVLNMLARGFSYAECADILRISANTVGFHVKNIYRKLEVNSRAEALFEALSQGLIARP